MAASSIRTEEAAAKQKSTGFKRRANDDALRTMQRHVELHPDDARALYFGASAWLLRATRERCLEWLDPRFSVASTRSTL